MLVTLRAYIDKVLSHCQLGRPSALHASLFVVPCLLSATVLNSVVAEIYSKYLKRTRVEIYCSIPLGHVIYSPAESGIIWPWEKLMALMMGYVL